MKSSGFSLVELIASLVIGGFVLLGVQQMMQSALALKTHNTMHNQTLAELEFALSRMVQHARESNRLLVPSIDRPSTSVNEALRDETVGISGVSAVLAMTLPASIDRDGDGFSDADNDRDARVDEDTGADMSNDGEPGLFNIDDNADQTIDNALASAANDDEFLFINNEDLHDGVDNDGDGAVDEDWDSDQNQDGQPGIAGLDDDGDGSIDEGSVNDDDEDGSVDEDWLDAIAFYLNGNALIERQPATWDVDGDTDVDGRDVVESVILDNVTRFRVERLEIAEAHYPLVDLMVSVQLDDGTEQSLTTRVRVGSSL